MTPREGTSGVQRALAALATAAVLTACAAAQKSASPPHDEPPPQTVDEALSLLDRAEADIDRTFGMAPPQPQYAAPPGLGQAPAGQPGATAEPATPSPPPAPAEREAQPNAGAPLTVSSDPCESACRALASMRRASDHLCDLAGESDERCGNARARVQAATERVRSRCPSC